MMAAQEEVYITRLTDGARRWIECRREVVPFIAGSRSSALDVTAEKLNGEAWWMMKVGCGEVVKATSKALGSVMSGTMTISRRLW